MAILDHIHIGCANVYTTAFDLTKTTKIGHYDGGFAGNVTIGQKTMPLGGGAYLEIESIVDPFATADAARRPWWYKRAVTVKSPIFSGVCLRVNTMEELTEIAKRHGATIRPKIGIRTPPEGPPVKFSDAPFVAGMADPWEAGRPTWCCWEDRLYMHPSGQPVVNASGLALPMGVAWLEMGGTKAQMQAWLGQNPDDLHMKFNAKSLGLYAIGVTTDVGAVEIRHPLGDWRVGGTGHIMPLHIDHISLASPHIFRSADTLAKETGLGYWTGEWLRESSVNIVPLGPPGNFIEISGFIDIFALREMNERRQWMLDITATGDHFNGLCLGVDSMEELEVFAKHWKSEINRADDPDPSAHFQRANGYILPMASTPVTKRTVWMLGLPNVYYYPDRTQHSSGQPTHAIPNQVRPTGLKWVEVGGTAQQMADWLGGMNYVEMLPLKFNGKSLGVWAVCVGAEGRDDIVIRRPAASDAVPVTKFAD